MTTSSVSNASSISSPAVPQWQVFKQLVSAIQSGNLSAAQDAYGSLTQNGGSASGAFTQALSQIGNALQSGNIDQAQTALSTLQQQTQALAGVHRHHGHHHPDDSQAQGSNAPASTSSDPTATTISTQVDVTA